MNWINIYNFEYTFEQIIRYLKKDIDDQKVDDYLFIFELIKLYDKLIGYTKRKQLYFEQQEEIDYDDYCKVLKNYKIKKWSTLKNDVKQSLNKIERMKKIIIDTNNYNSQIMINQNKYLKIPSILKEKPTIYVNKRKRIIINIVEYISFFRPIIYYLCRKIYQKDSFKPYFINLFIEIVIYLVNIFIMKSQILNNSIIKNRMKVSIINNLLRNPIYKYFIQYNLELIVGKIFFINFFKNIVLNLLKYRASQSF